MSKGVAPRHLAEPHPHRRRRQLWAGVGVVVLLALTAVAWAGIGNDSGGGADRSSADRSAVASPSTGDATSTSGRPTTTGAAATTAAKADDDGPKNLLANAGFEAGAQGWRPVGGARLTRSPDARSGSWSLRIQPEAAAGGPVGIAVPAVTVTKLQGRYHTNAWVRPSSPGTTVTIGLREYRGGRPVPGSNTLGWTVERVGWRQFGAIHVASVPGSRLALEIMARDLPPGGYLDIDEVVLHQLGDP